MITLPSKLVPFIAEDLLKIFLTALFIDFNDKRLICLMDQQTLEVRVEILRDSFVFEDIISALDLFGEEDILRLLAPKIEIFANELSLGRDFKESLEDNFKELT
jgi:hypothetical protein